MEANEQTQTNQSESKGEKKKNQKGFPCEVWKGTGHKLEARAEFTGVWRGPPALHRDPVVNLVCLPCRWCRGAGEGASQPRGAPAHGQLPA